jgi:hypothetical protein
MRQVNSIVIMGELNGESECVVVACILPLHRVLVVANVTTSSVPSLAIPLGFMLRVNHWTHPMVVERIRLHKVYDVEAIGFARSCVFDSEIVPLSVPPGVVVRLKNQVILEFIHLNSSPEIP